MSKPINKKTGGMFGGVDGKNLVATFALVSSLFRPWGFATAYRTGLLMVAVGGLWFICDRCKQPIRRLSKRAGKPHCPADNSGEIHVGGAIVFHRGA